MNLGNLQRQLMFRNYSQVEISIERAPARCAASGARFRGNVVRGQGRPDRCATLKSTLRQGRRQIAAEFFDKVDGYARVDPSLAIEKRRFIVHGNDCAVPDIRVQIQAPGAIAPKADEFLRRDVIAGKRERYDETGAVHREEQLTAIGMIVGAPDQSAFTSVIRRRCGNLFRPIAPTEQVAVADGIVRRVERFSMPPKFEQSFGYTPLIARVGVDLTPA